MSCLPVLSLHVLKQNDGTSVYAVVTGKGRTYLNMQKESRINVPLDVTLIPVCADDKTFIRLMHFIRNENDSEVDKTTEVNQKFKKNKSENCVIN